MGPSGCGKSTLLDMLAMKKTAKYSGEVLVNGHARDARLFRRIAAYVGQEDVMPAHWRVREAIRFNIALKTQGLGAQGQDAVVDLLLEAFGLAGVADTYIGGSQVRGISGGQRRRVTLARGVAARASIMFCDEPTSGLSATDAELCIKALRAIASRLGVLILVVIHQPRIEVAQLFDTLLMLTSNPGRMTYLGPMASVVTYMEACGCPVPEYVNPTDYFLDLTTPGLKLDASEHFVDTFRKTLKPGICEMVGRACGSKGLTIREMLQAMPVARPGKYAAPFTTQFTQLLRRKLAITMRNPLAIGLPLVLPVAMAIIVGTVFLDIAGKGSIKDVISFLFVLMTGLCFGGIQLMPIQIEERGFMKYETSEALYSELASALASFCVDVPLSFIGAAYQALIIFAFSGLDSEYLEEVFFWCMLLFIVYDSFYSVVAAFAEDAQQAQALATPIISIFMLFNGFVVSKTSAPSWLRWIFLFSPNGYVMQAFMERIGPRYPGGDFLLQRLGYVDGENMQGIAIMLCMTALFRVLQLVLLRKLHNVQK